LKLLRLKITDPEGFRSLRSGFEHNFRTEKALKDELANSDGIAPFVCAGANGSGKSNLLEALAAIFFQLEVQRVRRSFLPENFLFDEEDNPEGFQDGDGLPNGFELDYLIQLPVAFHTSNAPRYAKVNIVKTLDKSPDINWCNFGEFNLDTNEIEELINNNGVVGERLREFLLPQYVLGYSSGENEVLSLPFFKMRFIQYDEYLNALKIQLPYFGRPETRLIYLDSGFSQAILLCNLLFFDADTLKPFREKVGIEQLSEFRIIIRRSIEVNSQEAASFGYPNDAITLDSETNRYTVNLMKLLEADDKTLEEAKHDPQPALVDLNKFIPAVTRLKRCATCFFVDEETDNLYLDYFVNDATKQAFRENFRALDTNGNPALGLFHALQVLLTLNLYSVSSRLKADLYKSDSHYVSETVPTLASDQRIMRIKNFYFTKQCMQKPMLLKELSDGEHQLLHSLGLCLLFRNTNSLFLLDEPETHFNPDWRANFINWLRHCLRNQEKEHNNFNQEMLITTHAPFLISDSRPEKVLVFSKDKTLGSVSILHPKYNTLGASINKITMETFDKYETIGAYARQILQDLLSDPSAKENPNALAKRIMDSVGDSIERALAVQSLLSSDDQPNLRDETE
jgi:restriction system-associated AAA family ATPase